MGQRVAKAVVEIVYDGVAAARLALHVDHGVAAHCGAQQQASIGRLVRRARLAVDRDHDRTMAFEAQRHDSGKRGVDEPDADALAAVKLLARGHKTVDRDSVADMASHRRFHPVAEAGSDLRIGAEAPVHDHPHQLAVHRCRLWFLYDQGASKAAAQLFQRCCSAGWYQKVPASGGVKA